MTDISNTKTKLMKPVYLDMYRRYAAWKQKTGTEPRIIYTQPGGKDYVTLKKFKDIQLRFDTYWKQHGVQPLYVCVNHPCTTPDKSALRRNIESAIGSYNTFTEYYNRLKGRGYSYYYNDIYNQYTAIQRLRNRQGLNCADSVQVSYAAAKDLGYQARYVHIICRSGTGHIQLDVKGKEFGNSWRRVDPAAALKSSYPIGDLWCSDGHVIAYNPGWMLSDDGQ